MGGGKRSSRLGRTKIYGVGLKVSLRFAGAIFSQFESPLEVTVNHDPAWGYTAIGKACAQAR
jgi:hypothetical protein